MNPLYRICTLSGPDLIKYYLNEPVEQPVRPQVQKVNVNRVHPEAQPTQKENPVLPLALAGIVAVIVGLLVVSK
jgi:hypothetical protein